MGSIRLRRRPLIHSDLDVTSKVLRDILTEDVSKIVVDNVEEYNKIVRFLRTFMPRLNYAIELYPRGRADF